MLKAFVIVAVVAQLLIAVVLLIQQRQTIREDDRSAKATDIFARVNADARRWETPHTAFG